MLSIALWCVPAWGMSLGLGGGGPGPGGMGRQEVRLELDLSVHQSASCVDCHGHDGHKPWSVKKPELATACGSCHQQEWDDFSSHAHGKTFLLGDFDAPSCVDCHGAHDVQSRFDVGASTNFAKVSDSCGKCHSEELEDFTSSAHGSWWPGIPEANSATCVSCHQAHIEDGADVLGSGVSLKNLSMTCGQCHTEESLAYQPSVHAKAIEAGNIHAASCVDCHGGHDVSSIGDLDSPLDHFALAGETCARCHESVELTQEHDLPIDVVSDFEGSFHGLALAGGDRSVANCASCHGTHEIRPSSDPASFVHPANLDMTCGRCHPGAAEGFASGGVHHFSVNWGHRLVSMVRVMYIGMIVVVLGGMAIHNGLDFRRRLIDCRKRKRAEKAEESSGRHESFLRFTIIERVQHWVLAGSFIALVVSGFALKFGWKVPLVDVEHSETVRAISHRAAASLLMVLAVYHAGYLLLSRRGRMMGRSMIPRIRSGRDVLCVVGCCLRLGPGSTSDWRDLIQMVKYNLGMVGERPAMGRFGYAEKMEYLALIWGSLIMIVTGLILWFEVPFLNRVPFWGFELATLVHYFEAILATLAIVIWHFYFTMLNPNVFPVSKTMITGRISRHEMELDHAEELESIESDGHADECGCDGSSDTGCESEEEKS
ncbi:MAG: cytochrome b/b6 domain-containing protein [Phycisphaerales bacterium]|nr:cytochrome b/b6 domain-containing protein [Phycisphaerales bacterium]